MTTVREDILQFLHDPPAFAAGVTDMDRDLWLRGLSDFAQPKLAKPGESPLRDGQARAWVQMAPHRTALVLGPPGTGKTFALAWMAAGYIHARRAAGLECRVLVAGFTRESMGNLLDHFYRIAQSHLPGISVAFIGNAPDARMHEGIAMLPLKGRADSEKARAYLEAQHLFCAMNGWQMAKLIARGGLPECDGLTARIFDLILIDEASQMPVSHGLMALSGLAVGGRVIIAGDDRQLGPVRTTFDVHGQSGHAIGKSLYAFLKSANVQEVVLDETFRLNRPLVAFPAEHLYEGRYKSAVPNRRLALRDGWETGLLPWQRVTLDPAFPVVVLLHDGPASGTVNPFERHLIRSLVRVLAERLLPAGEAELGADELWSQRLAVITPHRAQNAALRAELAVIPLCSGARVETVDRFQGRERDAIIAGYTVSDPEFAQQEAEFLFSFERLNVTVTRSRSKLILLVSRRLLEVLPTDEEVFDDAQLLREYIFECASAGSIELEASDGRMYASEVRVRGFETNASAAAAALLGMPSQDVERAPGRVIRLTYEDSAIDTPTILRELGLLTSSYTYIVSTQALKNERIREIAAAPHQRTPESDETILRFDEVLRGLFPGPVLGRTSERLYLQRAIKRALANDANVARQVRHDVFPWLEALAYVAERGLDLEHPLPKELDETLVTRAVGETLASLQRAHREVRPSRELRTFEEAARELLDHHSLDVGNTVVMEGFTYLTALQRRFADVCLEQGKTVCFVHASNPPQAPGFAIMERTYQPFEAITRRIHFSAKPVVLANDLDVLRQTMFAESSIQASPMRGDPDSVTFDVYPHRHDEAEACMKRILEYTKSGQELTFAIVTRNPHEFDSLLQEQGRVHGLPNSIGMEPRRLLLTPLGRFALTLYSIRTDGQLNMASEDFETMLASGWLGDDLQGTVHAFSGVRPQIFDRCRSPSDWEAAFSRLAGIGLRPPEWRLPSAAVNPAILARWRDAYVRIDNLSQKLFTGPEDQSIGGRIRQLLDELAQLDPAAMRETEREVLLRIREALTEMADAGGMHVNGTEFGEILNGLVKEYDAESDPTSHAPPPEQATLHLEDKNVQALHNPPNIWVTTPEGIDSYPRDVVFYIGVDNSRVPRPAVDPWPFYEDKLDAGSEQERYLFLAVVRAARKRLHMSYAVRGEGATYSPSPFVSEAEAILGRAPAKLPRVRASEVAEVVVSPAPRPVPRVEYTLHEIAIAALCPYRYKLERLDNDTRLCRDSFHLRFMAQAVWIEEAYADAAETSVPGNEERIETLLLKSMSNRELQVRSMFPALRDIHWTPVASYVEQGLRYTAKELAKNYLVQIERAPVGVRYEIQIEGRKASVNLGLPFVARVGRLVRPLPSPVLFREWMLPKQPTDETNARFPTPNQGQYIFADLYSSISWWRQATKWLLWWAGVKSDSTASSHDQARTEYAKCQDEVVILVKQIESGVYPKNIGNHCRVCPVKSICLGVEE